MTEIETSEARQILARAAKLIYSSTTGVQRPLVHLHTIQYAEEQLEHARRRMVDGARREGASWAEIGRALGITRQAARQHYGEPVTTVDGADVPLPFG